jgi:hypothetical protein
MSITLPGRSDESPTASPSRRLQLRPISENANKSSCARYCRYSHHLRWQVATVTDCCLSDRPVLLGRCKGILFWCYCSWKWSGGSPPFCNRWGPGSIPRHSMLCFCSTTWYWHRSYPPVLRFSFVNVIPRQCSMPIFTFNRHCAILAADSVDGSWTFKGERCVFYVTTRCVPRRKHSPPRLHPTSLLMFYKIRIHRVHFKAMWAAFRVFEC